MHRNVSNGLSREEVGQNLPQIWHFHKDRGNLRLVGFRKTANKQIQHNFVKMVISYKIFFSSSKFRSFKCIFQVSVCSANLYETEQRIKVDWHRKSNYGGHFVFHFLTNVQKVFQLYEIFAFDTFLTISAEILRVRGKILEISN